MINPLECFFSIGALPTLDRNPGLKTLYPTLTIDPRRTF